MSDFNGRPVLVTGASGGVGSIAIALLALAGCGGNKATSDETLDPVQLAEALQDGGYVVYLRHAATDQSKEDAGVVDLEDCSTQRNLTDAGREQADGESADDP